MGKGKVGVSTSRIENTREVVAITSDCKNCFHSINKNGMLYCKYYDTFSPRKRKCVRYSFLDKSKEKKNTPRKELVRAKKEPVFPWERA